MLLAHWLYLISGGLDLIEGAQPAPRNIREDGALPGYRHAKKLAKRTRSYRESHSAKQPAPRDIREDGALPGYRHAKKLAKRTRSYRESHSANPAPMPVATSAPAPSALARFSASGTSAAPRALPSEGAAASSAGRLSRGQSIEGAELAAMCMSSESFKKRRPSNEEVFNRMLVRNDPALAA